MNNDLISREALKGAIEQEHQRVLKINPICSSISLNMLNKILDNAPTVPNEYMRGYEAAEREYKNCFNGKSYDKVIDEVTELLENEWGYVGMRDDVARIMKGEEE